MLHYNIIDCGAYSKAIATYNHRLSSAKGLPGDSDDQKYNLDEN
jgi:hypothetical protein